MCPQNRSKRAKLSAAVLDSSSIIPDLRFQRAAFRALSDSRDRTGIRVYVPMIVVEEVVSNYDRGVHKLLRKLQQATFDLGELLGPILPVPVDEDHVSDRVRGYSEQWLPGLLRMHGIRLLSYPSVSHEEMVRRAVKHRKPFTPGGKGYRDALIWESILELLAGHEEGPVALVTRNSKDFAGEDGSLHPDLRADLVNRGIAEDHIVYCAGLEAFVGEYVKPELETLSELRKTLESGEDECLDVRAWMAEKLVQIWRDAGWTEAPLPVPSELGEPSEPIVSELAKVKVLDVKRLNERESLADLRVDFDIELTYMTGRGLYDCSIQRWTAEGRRPSQVLGLDIGSEHVCVIYELPLTARVSLLLDTDKREVLAWSTAGAHVRQQHADTDTQR